LDLLVTPLGPVLDQQFAPVLDQQFAPVLDQQFAPPSDAWYEFNPSNYFLYVANISQMRTEGFSFNAGGLEIGGVLAQRCSSDCNHPRPFATVCTATAVRWLGLTVGLRLRKCDQEGRFPRK